MIRINLLAVQEAAAGESRRQELSLVGLGLLLLLLALAAVRFHQSSTHESLEARIADLQLSVGKLRERVGEVASLDEDKRALDAKLAVIDELRRKRVGPALVLDDLSKATPERLWLTELSEFNGAATVTGEAVDNQTIADFLRSLSQSRFFSDVDLVETTQSARSPDVKLRTFLLKAKIDYGASRPPMSADGDAEDPAAAEGTS